MLRSTYVLWVLGVLFVPAKAEAQSLSERDIRPDPGSGYVFRSYPTPRGEAPLLRRFWLEFTSEREITGVGLQPLGREIELTFHDDTPNDVFHASIAHQPLGSNFTTGFTEKHQSIIFGKGNQRMPLARSDPSGFQFVILGFRFFFNAGSADLDRIGILQDSGYVEVFFTDDTNDMGFTCILDYAYVPDGLIVDTGKVTGSSRDSPYPGGVRHIIPRGISVIRGFKIDFERGDHCVKGIGIGSWYDGLLDIMCYDDAHNDAFDYEVRWAIVNPPVGPGPLPFAFRGTDVEIRSDGTEPAQRSDSIDVLRSEIDALRNEIAKLRSETKLKQD